MDTRSTLRYEVDLPATISLAGAELACRVRNVSLGGVFIRGPILTIGTKLVVRFKLPRQPDFEVACTARWVTADGTGVQFGSLRSIDTYMLAKFIRAGGRATGRFPTDAILGRSSRL